MYSNENRCILFTLSRCSRLIGLVDKHTKGVHADSMVLVFWCFTSIYSIKLRPRKKKRLIALGGS